MTVILAFGFATLSIYTIPANISRVAFFIEKLIFDHDVLIFYNFICSITESIKFCQMKSILFIVLTFVGFAGKLVLAQQHYKAADPDKSLIYSKNKDLFENDGGVASIISVPTYQCITYIVPSVEIINYGSNTLTNAVIGYFIDSDPPDFFTWEGSLPPGAIDTIQFSSIQVNAGPHILTVSIVTANGLLDINSGNNNGLLDFYIVGSSIPAPVYETFTTYDLPEGYFIENFDGEATWSLLERTDQLIPEDYMLQMHFFYSNSGNVDEFYLKNIDLSNMADATLSFDLAYTYYTNTGVEYADELKVLASADCGTNWNTIYHKMKDELATVPADDIEFIPVSSSQWRTDFVDLTSYLGYSDVMFRFEAISGHGNNLYLDNLNISATTAINEFNTLTESLEILPNPANSFFTISYHSLMEEPVSVIVSNLTGQIVYRGIIPSSHKTYLNAVDIPEGVYLVSVFNNTILLGYEKVHVIH